MKYWQVLFLLLCCLISEACLAGDSLPVNKNHRLQKSYLLPGDENSPLFTGSEYEPCHYLLNEGIPFFQTKDWIKGTLNYQHIQYTGVGLKYDMVQEKLLTLYSDSTTELALVMEKVNSFDLGGHHFVHMRFPASAGEVPPEGIYDQLYNGGLSILVKRQSFIEESIVNSALLHTVTSLNRYYLFQRGIYKEFSGKKNLLDLLTLSRRKANSCLRRQQLRFNKEPERSILALVEFAEKQPH